MTGCIGSLEDHRDFPVFQYGEPHMGGVSGRSEHDAGLTHASSDHLVPLHRADALCHRLLVFEDIGVLQLREKGEDQQSLHGDSFRVLMT